jgi:hypothetical protein
MFCGPVFVMSIGCGGKPGAARAPGLRRHRALKGEFPLASTSVW